MKPLTIPSSTHDLVLKSLGANFLGFETFDFDAPIKSGFLNPLYEVFISPHFRASEVVHSITATLRNIPNEISVSQLMNAAVLAADVLEPLRVILGHPIHVSSWFRSPTLNHQVGGVPRSYHLEARAADIPLDVSEFPKVISWCKTHKVAYVQYKTFIHVQI